MKKAIVASLALLWLAGCGTPQPPARWLALRGAPPPGVVAPTPPTAATHWQLLLPVRLPEYLDRDALLVPQGAAGLQPLAGWRWAEPLRTAVPRLLRDDLATLLGPARLWTSPLPPGLVVQRQLRVELLGFEANEDRSELRLRARWSIIDPAGALAPRVETAAIQVPSGGGDGDALAAAHRAALWRLAERIVAGEPRGSAPQ